MTTIRRILLALSLIVTLAVPAFAVERTVTLEVDNMTCTSCPYIVKKSLEHVPGVTAVAVSFEKKTATVRFDGAITSIAELTRAAGNAGYPSRLRN